MKKIGFIFFDAGGGHRAAATALKSVIEQQGRPWEIELINLQEILDPLDVFRKITRIRLQDLYNRMLANGWTLGSAYTLRAVHGVIRLYHRPVVRLLQEYWRKMQPDMAVSLVPNFNRALHESLGAVLPSVPFTTILTDFADWPPHFWIEPQTPGKKASGKNPPNLICGTRRAVEQALALGHAPGHVFETSGMILRPSFHESAPENPPFDRAAARRALGLDPVRPTGIVLFGGQGSSVMLEIAERLRGTQLILICGKNRKLADALRAQPASAPRVIEGFTENIPDYMRLADFFIGKAGPGSISEAMAMKLPVIIERNAWTLPQERYNAEWVLERKVGIVLPGFRKICPAVDDMLARAAEFRAAVDQVHNRAVFEIPEILERILEGGSTTF